MTKISGSPRLVLQGMFTGHPISYWEFTRKGAVVTALTVGIAVPYLWLRYFVLA